MFVTRSLSLDFPTYPLCDQDKFFKFSGLHLQSVYWNACTQSYDRHLSWGLGSSVQFSRSVRVSDSLQPHELQHARPACPSPTPGVYSNSCPLSWWCHPTISSSVVPFSSCPQSFPASGSLQMSQFFASGGQSIGVSASLLLMNIQDWSPLGWTGWIFCSPRDPQESSPIPQFKSNKR